MKPLKKILAIGLLLMITVSVCLAVSADKAGNHAEAQKYELVSLLGIGAGAIAKVMTGKRTSFGLLSKSYFTENRADNPLARCEKAIWDYLNGNTAKSQTIDDLRSGRMKMLTYAEKLMFTIAISTTGRKELYNQTTGAFEGRIPEEWNQGALPAGINLAVSHVRIGYATDGTITVPEGDVDYVTQPNSWPAALRNAQIVISQAGKEVVRFRAMYAGTQAASVNSAVEGDGLEFQRPFILEEQKQTKIEIITPQGVAFPATPAGLFLEVALFGVVVRPAN